jgi:hypothetical protein
MPVHSKTRSSADGGGAPTKTKTKVSATSGDAAAGSARGPGGRVKGKAAICAEAKNAAAVKAVLTICRGAADAKGLLADLQEEDLTLARVTAVPGGRHLVVTLMTGEAGVIVPISKAVAFRGGARTKGDLPNCMGRDDLVVLYGAMARGKISATLGDEVRDIFRRLGVAVPATFFPMSARDGGDGWCFDREDERLCEEAELVGAEAAAAAAAAAARAAREGGYANGRGALGVAARAALYGADHGGAAAAGADDVDVEAI